MATGNNMTVHDILNEATKALEAAGIPSARLDAEVLLLFASIATVWNFSKIRTLTISETQLVAYSNLIARRLQWEPVAYITAAKNSGLSRWEVNNSY